MSQLEAVIVATFIGSGVVALVLVLSVLLLPLAPTRIQKSVKAGITRWNEESIRVIDRGLYAVAVVLITQRRSAWSPASSISS